ncbi:Outer membrane protein TolC precursor [compost metagenome]
MTREVFAGSLLAILCAWSPVGAALEASATEQRVSSTAIRDTDEVSWSCDVGPPPTPLTLENMIEQVLCHDPQTRQAWAEAKAQAAQVGVTQAAYLPRLDARSAITRGNNSTTYVQQGEYSMHGRQQQLDHRLDLSWVLFDFGRRKASLRNARQLLVAANANQDSRLQEAFVQAAQLYYDTLAAQDSQRAAEQVAALAAENLKDASAKYEAGAAALSDRLQAQTAYSQASLNEVRGQGVVRNAQGQIALHMGLPPETPLELAGSLKRRPDTAFIKGVDELLEQARQDHPSLIAAKARLEAAKAAVEESKAAGRPTLSFLASISDVQTRQPMAYNGDNHARDNSVGLQLSIPLFEGFEHTYQARGAQARFQASEAELADVEQRVSLELWTSYQALNIETQALGRTAEWVEQATLALHVVQGRYRSGVGSMIELLNASSAFAAAEQQHIIALNSWHLARLKLAASLGRLGFWAL